MNRARPKLVTLSGLVLALFLLSALVAPAAAPAAERRPAPIYEEGPKSRDGIGKFYLGREISQVMGHEGADWLERPERLREESPELLHELLGLKRGMVVADIGAGTGYHSWRMARQVGPSGKVYAVDIQPEMLALIAVNMPARGVSNVVGVLGTTTSPKLPANSLDLVLMVDVYHEFNQPHEMLTAISQSLKSGGRVAFVEYRAEDPLVPIKGLHKMTEAQVRLEAERHNLVWVETHAELPWQHLILFRKR